MSSLPISPTPFGAPMSKYFLFDKNYKNLNHGSFGTYPSPVRTALHKYQAETEARPDLFIRYTRPKLVDESRKAVARLLSVPTNECVLVHNATTGINTVLRNLTFQQGDVIVYFETIYGAIEKTIVSLTETTPLSARKVAGYDLSCIADHEELVERFLRTVRDARAEGLNVKIAVFDVMVSNPGVRFPFERLTEVCREEGILSVVDGAHGIGMVPLDLGRLNPDFFTSNCHKWLYAPRGCAVLYVPVRNQHLIRTTIPTSWGFIPSPSSAETPASTLPQDKNKSAFETLFEFVATSDDTPYVCIPEAIKFRNEVCGGDERIFEYLERLANSGADIVASALGTEVMQERNLKPGEVSKLRRCAMTTVRLPLVLAREDGSSMYPSPYKPFKKDELPSIISWMETRMTEKYGTFVPVFLHGSALWTRLSAQIYLENSDFEWLAGVLKELCETVGKREVDLK